MLLSLLRYPMGEIGAEVRLFMASFVMRFGGAGAVQLTVLELAERLRMPPRVVMQAVSKLSTAEAYLVVKKVSVGRGRPSRSFEVSPSILAILGEYPGVSCPPVCEQIIKNLLSIQGEGGKSKTVMAVGVTRLGSNGLPSGKKTIYRVSAIGGCWPCWSVMRMGLVSFEVWGCQRFAN